MSDSYKPTLVERDPGAIRSTDVVAKLWGDASSGLATDLTYVANEEIQQIIFEIAPGGRFTHSEQHRTIFSADQLYHVLGGRLVLANPSTGELHNVECGNWIYLEPGSWHHGFNQSEEKLRVLEYFAPPPAMGTSQLYARTQPYLEESTYSQAQWLTRWPIAASEARRTFTQHLIRSEDYLWQAEGRNQPMIVAIVLSTPRLTVGIAELLPGQRSDTLIREGAQAGFVFAGELSLLLLSDSGARSYYNLQPSDGFYVPERQRHEFLNMSSKTVRFSFGMVPGRVAT